MNRLISSLKRNLLVFAATATLSTSFVGCAGCGYGQTYGSLGQRGLIGVGGGALAGGIIGGGRGAAAGAIIGGLLGAGTATRP